MAGRGQGNQNYPYNNPYAGSYAQNYQQQGQYGYGGGGWEGDYYEEYQGNENLDQDDFDNLAEIERVRLQRQLFAVIFHPALRVN
jgi:hypothetical protein